MGGAGVVVLARDACRHCKQTYCVLGAGRNGFAETRTRGGIVAVVVHDTTEATSSLCGPRRCNEE